MADPKFENLPGIAYDQPDVYETPDVPEADTTEYYEEEPDNEYIQYVRISCNDSFRKFGGKEIDSSIDFSDRIGKPKQKKYEYICYDGEKETPFQKLQRLQFEMNELLTEIGLMQNDKQRSQEEKESYDAVANVIMTSKKVIDSLRSEQVMGKEQIGKTTEQEVKNLINQVEEYKSSGVLTHFQDPSNNLASSARIAKLEHRLHLLEQVIGAQPDKLSRLTGVTGTLNLLEAVRQLSIKAAIIQPNQLNQIETRVVNLSTKMGEIAEITSGSRDGAKRDHHIYELYEIAKKTENIAVILPEIIERMQALESLHKYAMNLSKIVAEVEETQNSISSNLVNNKSLLDSVQEQFSQNMESLNKEVSKLDSRINALSVSNKTV